MPAEFFLDTNVFVYTFDASAPGKLARAQELVGTALEAGSGAISWQVAQEFLSVALHRFERPLTPRETAQYLDEVLAPLCQVLPTPELLRDALAIHTETAFRFYDSLIVASAVASGARTLYTEDLPARQDPAGRTCSFPARSWQ